MATLEKIRSKSVLLLVIIGAALIAFIIGDFFTSGRTLFGTGTTVAKVGSNKIDVQEFQRRVEQANQQAQQQNQKVDQAALQQQVLNAMIGEQLYRNELKDLGLVVTDSELSEAMLGAGSAYLDQMVQQQVGVESAAVLHDMAFNPVKYGLNEQQAMQLSQYWVGLENQMEEMLLQQKFQNLFAGTLVANQLDAKALYDDNASTATILLVNKDFNSVPNDKYEVTSDDLKAEWAKNKAQYALNEEVRTINYINVEIVPSAEDIVAAEQRVESALADLNSKPDMEGVADKTDFVANRSKVAPSAIRDNQIKRFADTAAVGQAALVSRIGNDFTLAKMLGKSVETDSVNIDFIGVAATGAQVDSLINALNAAGKDWNNVIASNAHVQQVQDSMWVSLIDPQTASLKESLLSAGTGVFFTPDTAAAVQGARIFRVNSRKAPVTVYDMAVIAYTAEPSAATVNTLQSGLQTFINNNKDSKSFTDNAGEAGYQSFPVQVSASTPQVGRFNDSRNVVSWAMNAKKGDVSPIFGDETTGRFMVAALTDIYDDYIPARDPQVNTFLTQQVRNDKKAADLISQYAGKANDIAGYAQLMEASIDSASVNFGQVSPYAPGVGGSEVAALVATAQPNTLVGPVKGNNGVMVFTVVGVDNQGRPYNFDESAALYSRTRGAGALSNALQLILLGNQKVENNILKFFRD